MFDSAPDRLAATSHVRLGPLRPLMNPLPTPPFVASDPAVAAEIERWLDRQGYQMAYGPQSARAQRGDLALGSTEPVSTARAEAA